MLRSSEISARSSETEIKCIFIEVYSVVSVAEN